MKRLARGKIIVAPTNDAMVRIEAKLGLLLRDARLAFLRNPTKVKNAVNYILKRSIFPLNHKVASRYAIDCNKLVLATHNMDLNVQRITGVDRRAAGIFRGKKAGTRSTGGSGRGRRLQQALPSGCFATSPYSIAGGWLRPDLGTECTVPLSHSVGQPADWLSHTAAGRMLSVHACRAALPAPTPTPTPFPHPAHAAGMGYNVLTGFPITSGTSTADPGVAL